MLNDLKFLMKTIDLELYEYIDSQPHEWYAEFIIDFYKSYRTVPSMDSIKIKMESVKDSILRQALSATYIDILNSFDDNNLEFVKDTVINYCRFQETKQAIMKSIDLLKEQSYQEIFDILDKTRYKGLETDFGVEYVDSFDRRYTEDTHGWVETPWPVLNNALKGGLRKTKLGIVLAPPGVGKSWILTNLAAYAIQQGKKVIYYTLEMTQDEIGQRIDSILTRKSTDYIKMACNQEAIKLQIDKYKDNLRIKQYLPNKTKVIEIENHMKQLQLFDDFDADLLVIDYGDIIGKEKGVDQMYQAYGDVYTQLKRIAKEYKKAVWTASQGNRGSIEAEIVLGDNVSHSLGKLQIADVMLSASRKHEDKLSNTIRFLLVKNRGGKDGMVWNGIVDFDIGLIEMYDNYTQKSVQTRQKMDGNDALMKQKIRERLATLGKNKTMNGENI